MENKILLNDHIGFMAKVWDPISNADSRRELTLHQYLEMIRICDKTDEYAKKILRKHPRINSDILRIIFESDQRKKVSLEISSFAEKECVQVGIFNTKLQEAIEKRKPLFFISFPSLISKNQCIFFFNGTTSEPLSTHHTKKKKVSQFEDSIIHYSFVEHTLTKPIVGVSISKNTTSNTVHIVTAEYNIFRPFGNYIPVCNIESKIIFLELEYEKPLSQDFQYSSIINTSLERFEKFTRI